jgi:hypothetical protein
MPPLDDDDDAGAQQPLLSPPRPRPRHARLQRVLSTRTHHTVVLVLIALDVLAIFADIFIDLSACGPHAAPQSPAAAAARQVLSIASLVFRWALFVLFPVLFFSVFYFIFDVLFFLGGFPERGGEGGLRNRRGGERGIRSDGVYSCLFMAELTLYIWAFGWR